jgi:curli biogenesis system outer membrane secretion channel CsgG
LPVRKNNLKNVILVILGCIILGTASSVFAVEKPRIGVLRFTNNTHAYWWQAGTASELQDMLINELSATKAFHVLDRPELYSLLEHKFTEAVSVDTRTKPKTGKARGAKYLVVATVSAFEENTSGSGNSLKFPDLFSGEEQNIAYVVIDLKAIDGETGAIIESRSIEANSSGSALSGHPGNVSKFAGVLVKREKTPVGIAIRNCIIEITEYLECTLITKKAECVKEYAVAGTKKKEKSGNLNW